MTNGERIQTILDVDRDCTEVHGENGTMTFTVTQDWWNAEYNEPVIRDNGVKNELNRVKNELGVASGLEKNSKELEKDFGELDCISRADAIKAMQDKAKKLTNEDTINGLCGAVAILFDLPSVTPQEPRWISVSERLPEKDGEYLLWGKICEDEENNYCFIGEYDSCAEEFGYWSDHYDSSTLGFLDSEHIEYHKVLAWMPLPIPYEPQESEDKA